MRYLVSPRHLFIGGNPWFLDSILLVAMDTQEVLDSTLFEQTRLANPLSKLVARQNFGLFSANPVDRTWAPVARVFFLCGWACCATF